MDHRTAPTCLPQAGSGTGGTETGTGGRNHEAGEKAYLLGDAKHTPLKFTQQAGTFSVALPANAPDPIATVVCLQCAVGN